jgi:carboxypeptidase C (cathepsin A)
MQQARHDTSIAAGAYRLRDSIGGLLLALVLFLASAGANAEESKSPEAGGPSGGVLRLLPPDSITEHALNVGGRTLAYIATAGTLSLYGQSGERSAAVFYTSFVLKGAAGASRPITFAFNGGPGAASAFLHLGLAGPKILEFGPSGRDGADIRLRDNPETWLAFTDLVMIDPVGTGWSRPAKSDEGSNFWGVRSDAQSLAKVIALYVSHNARSASPKYLLGESYGGFRAVKVARALQQDQGIVAAGIVMVSPLLEGALQFGNSRFALGAALQLPSLAAAELERRKTLTKEGMDAAERFAMTEYLTTLAGPAPEGETGRAFYARVAQMTGIPLEVVTKSRGFIRDNYVKQTLRAEGDVVSPYDASFAAPDPFPEADNNRGPDPVLDGFARALGGAFADYARNDLGFKTEMTYMLLNSDVTGRWDWQGRGESRSSASVTGDIRELLSLNANFRILIAHGYSDMVTPFGVSRYVVDHLPPMGAPDRVQLKLYRGGHMLYFLPESRAAFSADAKAFYGASPE